MPVTSSAASDTVVSRTGRLLAAVLSAAVLVLGPGAGVAEAHDTLVDFAPVADAAVPTAPSSVTLRFSDAPQALGTRVVVAGPDGAPVSEGDAEQDGTIVRQPLAEGLPAGAYTVEWSVNSADGHPLSGTFGFTVDLGTAGEQRFAGAGRSTSRPMDTGGMTTASSGSSSPAVWVAVGVVLAVGVGLIVRQLRRPA